MAGLAVTLLLYLIALLAEPIAPFNPDHGNARLVYHPPQAIHWFDGGGLRPYVVAYRLARDPATLAATYVPDPNREGLSRCLGEGRSLHSVGPVLRIAPSVRPA